MKKFISGLKLSELFYKVVVKDILEKEFYGLQYSAALIDYGSEVLGYDTELSTDHNWGPRVLLFLSQKNFKLKRQISRALSNKLPKIFLGYSTHFVNSDELNVQLLTESKEGQSINHKVEIYTIETFFQSYLGINPYNTLTPLDWLTLSEQKLRTIRSGKIFHDQLGLKKIQTKMHYYPKDVWLYMLASEWMKISQEEPFVGRCGDTGDELGSKIITARLVKSIMKLCFLMEREYTPYSKWFGTAFSKLKCAKKLNQILHRVLAAKDWKERERHLSHAYKYIAQIHNALKITEALTVKVSTFHNRAYLVIHAEIFADELRKKIKDRTVKGMPAYIGSVNQLSNTVNLLENNKLLKKLKILYNIKNK